MAMAKRKRPRLQAQAQEAGRTGQRITEDTTRLGNLIKIIIDLEDREEVIMAKVKEQVRALVPSSEQGIVVEFCSPHFTLTHKFGEEFAAQAVIEDIIDDRKYTWTNSKTIKVGSLIIKCDKLEDVMEYEPSKVELAWKWPSDLIAFVKRIKGGKPEVTTVTGRTASEKPSQGSFPKREFKEGSITIASIAADLKIEPRIARGILRKNNVAKPYAWADAAPIIKMLKGAK